jgi:hypothetical protein
MMAIFVPAWLSSSVLWSIPKLLVELICRAIKGNDFESIWRTNQMNLTILFGSIGAVAVIWHVTTTILIYEALRKRNLKVSFLLLRLLAPKYATQYKEITRKETGKTGPLSFHWIISINAALIAAILILLVG